MYRTVQQFSREKNLANHHQITNKDVFIYFWLASVPDLGFWYEFLLTFDHYWYIFIFWYKVCANWWEHWSKRYRYNLLLLMLKNGPVFHSCTGKTSLHSTVNPLPIFNSPWERYACQAFALHEPNGASFLMNSPPAFHPTRPLQEPWCFYNGSPLPPMTFSRKSPLWMYPVTCQEETICPREIIPPAIALD